MNPTPNVPTVTAGHCWITVRRATSTAVVYIDNADREHAAAEICGAISDAYHAGRVDAIAEVWRANALEAMHLDTDPTPPHGIKRPADICDECGTTSAEPMTEVDHGHSIATVCAGCLRMDEIAENHADDQPRRTRSPLAAGYWL